MDNNKSTKKRATVRPMIITPLVFVLIALIFALPVLLKAYSVLKDRVYQAQETLSISIADYQPDDTYFNECRKEGTAQTAQGLKAADKVAEIECNNAAVICDVYYGINRASKRNGAGVSVKSKLFGGGGQIHIDGDSSGAFKALSNVEKGDVFTVTTSSGEYQYTVKEVVTAKEYSGKVNGEYLLITTDASHDVFAHQNKDNLIVVATLGAEEVSQ